MLNGEGAGLDHSQGMAFIQGGTVRHWFVLNVEVSPGGKLRLFADCVEALRRGNVH